MPRTRPHVAHTIVLNGHKTSVRLEPVMWEALGEIARTQAITRAELIRRINADRLPSENLTSAIRVYVVQFYRSQAEIARSSAPSPRKRR